MSTERLYVLIWEGSILRRLEQREILSSEATEWLVDGVNAMDSRAGDEGVSRAPSKGFEPEAEATEPQALETGVAAEAAELQSDWATVPLNTCGAG